MNIMVDRGLYNNIRNAIVRGKTKDEITADLAKRGWTQPQIDEAYRAAKKGKMPEIPLVKSPALPESRGPRSLRVSWIDVIFIPVAVIGLIYIFYYVVPAVDFDDLYAQITAYPALCTKIDGVVVYAADQATPVTFQVDPATQLVTEYTFSDYKSSPEGGTMANRQSWDNCTISDRTDWHCTNASGVTLGFTNGQFFDSALKDPNVCFVGRTQWYRLLYPSIWSSQ